MEKIIVLSGATKGLGLELYNSLKDYYIATISRSNETFENDCRLLYCGDITNKNHVSEFFTKIYDKWGKIDVLINNAGILGTFKKLTLYNNDEIEELLAINIKGTFLMTQEAINLMRGTDIEGGLIINIGSTRSITGAPNKSIYTMTKFALRGLTQCINTEYNIHNIYSTIVCPGSFKTVDTKEITNIIKYIIELPKEFHIPEIILGGKL